MSTLNHPFKWGNAAIPYKDSLMDIIGKKVSNLLVDAGEFLAYADWKDVKSLLALHKRNAGYCLYAGSMLAVAAYNFSHKEVKPTEAVAVNQEVAAPANSVHAQNKMDEKFYPYPHIRVEHGEPQTRRIDYSSSAYTGNDFVGAFARYLTVTPGQTVGDGNYIRSLDQMYELKYASNGRDDEAERLRQITYETYRSDRVYMTLGQYIRGVDQVIDESTTAIDFTALCRDRWLALDSVRCSALRQIVGNVDARMMVSYQMTEMFDKRSSGETNAWVLDQMYRYQGREAVDATPSLAGKIPVVGGFQITRQLVGTDGSQPRAITLVSNHSRLQVPNSTFGFRRTDHERAAFYSVVYNFGRLLKSLDADGVGILVEASTTKKSDVVALMAASHRGSGDAREFAVRWVYDGISNPIDVYMYTVDGRNYPEYASAARKNYVGLNQYITKNFPAW